MAATCCGSPTPTVPWTDPVRKALLGVALATILFAPTAPLVLVATLADSCPTTTQPTSTEQTQDDPAARPAGSPSEGASGCLGAMPGAPVAFTGDPEEIVADPTGTGGWVTAPTAHVVLQTSTAAPDTRWACWSPRPGTRSEHPLGRACDLTFGNPIGTPTTGDQTQRGWLVAEWLQTHADTLAIQYLIWQGRIWSRTRHAEGWRPYNGGGMHNPASITGGHYDHLHLTVAAGG